MGDFTGFSFGDWHSTDPETGIVTVYRVSGGDRYEEKLHPEVSDITAEVPGLDGVYFFGSNHKERTFDISIGFDSLTEEQFRKLRMAFNTKEVKELIFDERPYKKYMAKLEGPVELSFICFDEPKKEIDTERTQGIRIINRTTTTSSVISDVSEGLDITLSEAAYQQFFPDDGTNTFEYRNSVWYLVEEEAEVALENYGIEATITDPTVENIGFKITNSSTTGIKWEPITPYKIIPDEKQRIYKGEGKLTFVCHYPYAKSVFKQLNLELEREEWASSSEILKASEYLEFDKYDNGSGIIKIYNCGDLPANFSLYCPFLVSHSMKLKYYINENELGGQLNIGNMVAIDNETGHNDVGFLINSNNGLIQGVQSIEYTKDGVKYTTSKNFYNRYIKSGAFFKIERNINKTGADVSYFEITDMDDNIIDSGTEQVIETIDGSDSVVATYSKIQIFYDYLYF